MNAITLSAIASALVIAGSVVATLRALVRAAWRAVHYLERITSTLHDHEQRITRLEYRPPDPVLRSTVNAHDV